MMVIAVIIAGAIAFFAEMFFRLWFYSGVGFRRRSDEQRATAARAATSSPSSSRSRWSRWPGCSPLLIRFALSRSREFLADAGSVELTKNPDAMISALRKIEGRGELHGATSAVMEMCVDNPREEFTDLFSTHPSVEKPRQGAGRGMRRPRSRGRWRCRRRRSRRRWRATLAGGRARGNRRRCPGRRQGLGASARRSAAAAGGPQGGHRGPRGQPAAEPAPGSGRSCRTGRRSISARRRGAGRAVAGKP